VLTFLQDWSLVCEVKIRQTFRFYPSERQARSLARTFGCVRVAYNTALLLRTDSFKEGKTINYNASSAALTAQKKTDAFKYLNKVSSVPLQQALRHLQTAYSNFFAKRSKFPRFKSKYGKQSAEFTTSGFKWDAGNRNLTISKVGRLHVKWSREFASQPSTVTITKDCAGRYFVTLCLDEVKHALPKTGKQVGIDMGTKRLATLSSGERIANPRHTAKHAVKLAKLQRVLSRRVKGSNRWRVQKIKVARLHAHIADSRKDCLDKLTTRLVRDYDVLCIEDLNVRGMVKNHCLAKTVSCASFGMFRSMVEYKAAWYGKEVRVADRFFPSSKRCHCCGFVNAAVALGVEEWDCPECKAHHDRDYNASHNILKFAHASGPTTAGQAGSNGRGAHVRREGASVSPRNARRSVNQPGSANV
jgi:putative transposase